MVRPTEINPAQYQDLLSDKANLVEQTFVAFKPPKLEVFTSAPLHYRQRAEFRVWHDGDDLYHIMFDQQTKQKYRVEHYPPGSELINAVMADLIALLKNNDVARRKLFQIDYLSSLNQQIVVSLLYHKPLCDEWSAEISQILQKLRKKYHIHLIGRAKKQKQVFEQDFIIESLSINDRVYQFKQIENSFTQPNAEVNCKMIEWALDCTKESNGDLLELYCGSGNFTLPLAQNFRRTLATEISKPSVAAAQFNIDINQLDNVTILRMSSEEFTQAVNKTRTFTRLQGIDLDNFDCHTILVDPPRSGLDEETIQLVSQYQNILYISCNPDTLKDNLESLCQTHDIKRLALFDQFPYTHHAECGVLLQRK